MRSPNILFIMFDQLAPQALPLYGHERVQTPHLCSLAEQGVVFDNAYCNSPLCAPSRFSMLAGQLPSAIGAYDNGAEFSSQIPTFAHYLRKLGYRTCLSGKMHFVGPDQLHGFEQRLTTDVYPADFGWTADWLNASEPRFWFHNMQSVVEAGVYARTLNLDYDEEVGHQAVRFLYDAARDADERPLFLTVSFIQPHDPYMVPRACWDRYAHQDIDMPVVPAMAREQYDPHSARLFDTCQMAQYRITEAQVRNARHAYYGMISYVDEQVGRLVEALRLTGLDDSTVVLATADHGDMLGERGMWYKMSFFERSVRVPLVVCGPGIPPGTRISQNVSLVDLLPTFVALGNDGAGLDWAAPLAGHDLLALLGPGAAQWEDTVAGEYLAEGTTEPLLMLKTGRHKYVSCAGDPPQLFDCAADPHECHNLAGEPAHAALERRLASAVAERWDTRRLRARVIESQQRRLFLYSAMQHGVPTPWDYQPRSDATRQYNRNLANELYDTDRRARIPHRDPPPPDNP